MANYQTTTAPRSTKKLGATRPLSLVLLLTLAFAAIVGALSSGFLTQQASKEASALDPINLVVCGLFEEDSPVRVIYRVTQTDDLYYDLQSKSAVSSGRSDVNMGLNWILMATGSDFDAVNEDILGQEIEKGGVSLRPEAELTEEELSQQWNSGGTTYSVYDRFGMAGTVFTSYNGEWKYYSVDPCADSEPEDLHEGAYYDDRLEPRSTWEDRADSKDPRTIQHVKGETSRFFFGFVTLVANIIFWVTKLITTLTIAFVSFSFSDIVSLMGLDSLLTDGTTTGGLFGSLFTNIFSPFIIAIVAITGIKILWDAVRRQFRQAMGTALITILMFLFAIVVSAKPAFFVNLPNQAAVAVQAVVVQAFTGGLEGGDGLCSTDIGVSKVNIQAGTAGLEGQNYLEGISKNMSSLIGCSFWNTFVFKPWAEGQWGVSWNETWAKDSVASWAPSGAKAISNTEGNAEMVGDAYVPLGDGKVINNWAVFNLSAMTNAHSPVGHDGSLSEYSQGVAHDWWRIVDALTNYEEEDASRNVSIDDLNSTEEITAPTVKENNVDRTWETWSGNNPSTRLMAALSSLFIGAVGLIAPFFLGLMAAVYSLAMTIVMAFLPVMLLLACWGGRGFNIFKQWALLLWSLFTKRVAVGILLMLSIVFVNAAVKLMGTVGWWQGALMLVLLTFILIRSRHTIMNMFAASSAGSFGSVASRIGQGISNAGATIGGVAASTAGGAVYSKVRGGSFRDGAKVGFKNEGENLSYRIPFLRDVRTAKAQLDAGKQGNGKVYDLDGKETQYCNMCGEKFEAGSMLTQGPDGMWYCQFCAEGDAEIEGGQEVYYAGRPEEEKQKPTRVEPLDSSRGAGKITRIYTSTKQSHWDENKTDGTLDFIPEKFINTASTAVREDVLDKVSAVRTGEIAGSSLYGSNIPAEIQPYLNSGMIQSLIENEEWEAVASAFMAAYSLKITELVREKLGSAFDKVEDKLEAALNGNLAAVQNDPQGRATGKPQLRPSEDSGDGPKDSSN